MTDSSEREQDDPSEDAAAVTPEDSNDSSATRDAVPDDGRPVDAEVAEAEEAGTAAPAGAAEDEPASSSGDSAEPSAAASVGEASEPEDEDLPEWEPLTPELVEDEAIRGDFMLRWAVVLLAMLLGCREISETMSLVRIKTGQYLASHGILPPANDVFSYTAAEREWVNTAWLFDLTVGCVYMAGGAVAVSLFTAILAAGTLYLVVHITRPELPTWWTAVCAGVALVVLQTEFTALPEIVTLLGAAWTLRGLVNWSQTGDSSSLWCVVVSLAVWGNLDPRAFVGWILVAAFALGTAIDHWLGRRRHHESAELKDIGVATQAGLIALAVNPFGWHTLKAPISLYTVELPALIEYLGAGDLLNFPLYHSALWEPLSPVILVGVAVLGVAVLTSIANLRRLDSGLLLAFLASAGLALVCSHELAVASLVAVVTAALNGQDWYKANCRVEYSTGTLEVLWSRVGRALTVLALAAFAWLAVSGRLMGPDGKRVGVGFSPRLATNISGMEQDLEAVGDERMFVFRLEQGDLLIWLDRPTFVDSRVAVYAGGDEDILFLHNRARHALRQARPTAAAVSSDGGASAAADEQAAGDDSNDPNTWFGRRELWVETFDRFQVELAVPRLWGLTPDVQTWVDLENSPDWTQVELGATCAVFARTRAGGAAEATRPERVDFVQKAFRDCWMPTVEVERVDWPRPRTSYQNFLSLSPRPASVPALRARRHADWLSLGINGVVSVTTDEAFALATLVMRNAAAALDDDANNATAYQLQATACQTLDQLETRVLTALGLPEVNLQRYTQRMHALHQALTLEPTSIDLITTIGNEYFTRQRWDLALQMIQRALDQIRSMEDPSDQLLAVAQQLSQAQRELEPRMEAMESQLEQTLSGPEPDISSLIVTLAQQGFPARALDLFETHRLSLSGNLMVELQGAFLFAECGRLEDAETAFAAFESIPDDPRVTYQWVLQSAWLKMAKGEHENAIALCQRRLRDVERSTATAMLGLSSFVQPIPGLLGDRQIWPATLSTAASRALYDSRDEATQLRWTMAMAMIEAGLCTEAAQTLQELLDADPETRLRPLAALWKRLLTGEVTPALPASEVVPILFDGGPADPVDTPDGDDVSAAETP